MSTQDQSPPSRATAPETSTYARKDNAVTQPKNAERRRAQQRVYKTERQVQDAVRVLNEAQVKGERRVVEARRVHTAARRALYVTVPCDYCGAQVGVDCANLTGEQMHTSRWCDALAPVAAGGAS